MGPEGNILENSSISTFQQGLTHSALNEIGSCRKKPENCIVQQIQLLTPSCINLDLNQSGRVDLVSSGLSGSTY